MSATAALRRSKYRKETKAKQSKAKKMGPKHPQIKLVKSRNKIETF